jgi:hypothetical protein
MHTHNSSQTIDGQRRSFDHKGPIAFVGGRFYLVAVGVDANGGKYVRVMIMQTIDNPKRQLIPGMLLTERALNLAPMAATKVVMSSRE